MIDADLVSYVRVYQDVANQWHFQAMLLTGGADTPSLGFDTRDYCIQAATLHYPNAEIRYGT